MPNHTSWLADRIAKAAELNTSVTVAAVVRMELLLKNEFSERQLSSARLTQIATALLADMISDSPQEDTKQCESGPFS